MTDSHTCPICKKRPHRVFLMEEGGDEWHLAPIDDPKTYCDRERKELIHMPKGALSGLKPCVPCLHGFDKKGA